MGPELNLQVTYFLYRLLHLTKQTFKFDHIGKFRIDSLVEHMILLDMLLNYVLIPEDSELLLVRGLLLLSDIQLDQWWVNVVQNFKHVVWEGNVEVRTADEFAYRILVKLFYEVTQENLVQVRGFIVTLLKLVFINVKKFILSFTRAFLILAL